MGVSRKAVRRAKFFGGRARARGGGVPTCYTCAAIGGPASRGAQPGAGGGTMAVSGGYRGRQEARGASRLGDGDRGRARFMVAVALAY